MVSHKFISSQVYYTVNVLNRPRASAVAERLWTDPHNPDVDSARFRLDQQRCRMLQRGEG